MARELESGSREVDESKQQFEEKADLRRSSRQPQAVEMLSPEERNELLKELGIGKQLTPDEARKELDEWLMPSQDGQKELAGPEWALYVLQKV